MIPETKDIFNIVKNNIKNGTSFLKIIEYLEPFLIYSDDITFKQYQLITDFINDEINKHKKTLITNNRNFIKYIKNNKSFILPTF